MRDVYLAGLDIGTTGAKAILSDGEGRLVAQAGQEYPTAYPHANWAEQDPQDWWRATCQVVHRVLAQAGNGGILLSHDGGGPREQTLAAIAPIVTALKRRGYTFVTVSELLGYRQKLALVR